MCMSFEKIEQRQTNEKNPSIDVDSPATKWANFTFDDQSSRWNLDLHSKGSLWGWLMKTFGLRNLKTDVLKKNIFFQNLQNEDCAPWWTKLSSMLKLWLQISEMYSDFVGTVFCPDCIGRLLVWIMNIWHSIQLCFYRYEEILQVKTWKRGWKTLFCS